LVPRIKESYPQNGILFSNSQSSDINLNNPPSNAGESLGFAPFLLIFLPARVASVARLTSREGNVHVSSKVFSNPVSKIPSVTSAAVHEMPARDTSVFEARDFDAELQDLLDSISNGLGCVRAVQAAVAIEAAGAVLIYGIWFLVHLHR
jgi:hypothetical protein